MSDFKPAHNRAVEKAKWNWDVDQDNRTMEALESAYIAMLKSQDHVWRLCHQHVLCEARDALAQTLGLDSQTIQEHYESVALIERRLELDEQG